MHGGAIGAHVCTTVRRLRPGDVPIGRVRACVLLHRYEAMAAKEMMQQVLRPPHCSPRLRIRVPARACACLCIVSADIGGCPQAQAGEDEACAEAEVPCHCGYPRLALLYLPMCLQPSTQCAACATRAEASEALRVSDDNACV